MCREATLWETFQQWGEREERVRRHRGVRAGGSQRYTEQVSVASVCGQRGAAALCLLFGFQQ